MNKALDWLHISNSRKEVILRITKFCNQKCLFCFTEIDNKTQVSFDLLKKEIDKIILDNKWSNLNFVITGWEPTLHKELLDIINYIFIKWYDITLQSNWVNFSDKLIKELKKYSSKLSFFISFHSHLPKIYDFITDTNSQFDLAVFWIKKLLNNFDNITINIVFNKSNQWNIKWYFYFIWNHFYSINKNLRINFSVMSNVYKYKYIDKLLIKYTDLVNEINNSRKIIEYYNINIWSDFWWPCDLPFCIGEKLFYYKESDYSLRLESDRYIDRKKIDTCNICKYKNNCSWILKLYLAKYWEGEFKWLIK